jgi:hypothetical protein
MDEAELRRMTRDERRELARTRAAIDLPQPLMDPHVQRRRRFALLLTMASCIALAGWIAILIFTLPGRYTSSDWRAVWVGLDIAELLGFAATGWAAWHQRQIVILEASKRRGKHKRRGKQSWTEAITPSTGR